MSGASSSHSAAPEGGGEVSAAFGRGEFATLSEALDEHHRRDEEERAFDARAAALAARARREVEKRRKLLRNLEQDLTRHGDAEEHRRVGDLLLANIATAERAGARVRLTDFTPRARPSSRLRSTRTGRCRRRPRAVSPATRRRGAPPPKSPGASTRSGRVGRARRAAVRNRARRRRARRRRA